MHVDVAFLFFNGHSQCQVGEGTRKADRQSVHEIETDLPVSAAGLSDIVESAMAKLTSEAANSQLSGGLLRLYLYFNPEHEFAPCVNLSSQTMALLSRSDVNLELTFFPRQIWDTHLQLVKM